MPELRLNIVADDRASKLLDSVSGKLDKAGKAGKKFGTQVEKGARKVDNSLKKVEKQAKKTSGSFSKFGGILTGVFAGAAAFATIRFLSESLKLLSIQEQAVNDLALAMKNLGVFTEEALKEQEAFASEVQKVTIFGDEQILGLQALLTTFGLYGKELQGTTIATIDLATALGVDLKAAAILLGKAFIGETSSLSRYGIIIDKNIPKSEKFAEVINLINRQFGGAAAAQVKTFSGRVQKLGNAFGDLREKVGLFIEVPAQQFVKFLNRSVSLVSNVVDKINSLGEASARAGDSMREKIVRALQDQIIATRGNISALERLIGKLRKQASAQGLTTTAVIEAREANLKTAKEKIAQLESSIKAESKLAAVIVSSRNKEKKRGEAAAKADAEELKRKEKLAEGEEKRKEALRDFTAFSKQLSIERLEAEGQEDEAKLLRIEDEKNAKIDALLAFQDANKQISSAALLLAKEDADAIAKAQLDALNKTEGGFKKFEGIAKAVGTSIENKFADTFTSILLDGKTFSEGMKFFFKDLARIAIAQLTRIAVAQALLKIGFTSATGGFGAIFTGAVADHGIQRVPGPVGAPVPIIAHGGERISPVGMSPASTGIGGGGGGAATIQNIFITVQVRSLDSEGRDIILNDLAKSFRANTDAARNFASESELSAERNAGLSS